MRVVFLSLCAVFGVIVGYVFFGNASAKAYFFDRIPAAISHAFFSHNAEEEREETEIKELTEDADSANVLDADAIADEEARLQRSIKSVEEEIRRTEEFLQKKGAH